MERAMETIADPLLYLAALSGMLAGNRTAFLHVVRVFYETTYCDLAELSHLAALGEWPAVRRLAERIELSCITVGEIDVAESLACLSARYPEALYTRWVYINVYSRQRHRLIDLLQVARLIGEMRREETPKRTGAASATDHYPKASRDCPGLTYLSVMRAITVPPIAPAEIIPPLLAGEG
jgi:hypothetical protein